ncbi:MAG: hypothetical protein A3F13_09650 [Gammaproteobacteria bacterium RIFCSPHIGHO2_12_FULL_40_19]|nr:MAG: hypothetical protein A3F13_09650 [Gammaproteobacteria bacterium RIFCSPHIGHO2_12_FULL_40_19]
MSKHWILPFAIAHRGASKIAPENTIIALKKAKENGASWVECDIQFTKDNQPVIFHDATLARTTSGRGFLSNTTLSRVQSLDAGGWFSSEFKNERVPTLQEWLQTAAQLKLALNLEIKSTTKKESITLAETVIDHLQKYWPAHSTTLFMSSSNQFALMQIAERAKSLPLGLIIEKNISEKEAAALLNANIISVHQPYKILNASYVGMLHEMGLRVLAYTVNDLTLAMQLKVMGVDGIFTDDERLFQLK